MSSGPPQGGSFSLFPKERPPSRNQMNSVPGRPSIDSVSRDTPSRAGRHTPLERKVSVREGKRLVSGASSSAPTTNTSPSESRPPEPIITRPAAAVTFEPPPRCGTAFSEAQTLVRENSGRSRSSIAKIPLSQGEPNLAGEGGASGAPLRSIFPEYNPNLPLAHQNYYPTQTSPTSIPPAAISRRLYSPTSEVRPDSPTSYQQNNYQQQQQQQQRPSISISSPVRSPIRSPRSVTSQPATTTRKWPPPRVNEMRPTTPETSSTEQLRNFWKVANGWKASGSEGRVYTFKISCDRDAPIYTLASKTQPFYRMKLDPTSASAYVSLSRFDPSKPYKPPVPPKDSSNNNNNNGGGGSGGNSPTGGPGDGGGESVPKDNTVMTKGWQEVLSTTLEETARRHAPHDGLVALLFPLTAAKMALENQHSNAAAYATAERECARLVWDDDSGNHFLVHPALAMPFCVTVERNPTWSRTEYTLEHIESPRHLARLTKDGTGTGWVEIDTGIASKIDAVYLVDVAVAALVLVAHADGEFSRVEVFEPPPSFGGGPDGRNSRQDKRSSRISRLSARVGTGEKKKTAGKSRLEELELDLESQASDFKKYTSSRKDKDGTPGCARAVIGVLSVTFKCFIWCATVAFKALTGLIALLAKCVTSEKL